MDVANPYGDLLPGARGRLLATLVQLETPATVRALARYSGISPQGALSSVNDLSEAGIVLVDHAGPALLVRLNREHLAVEPLVALVGLRGRLVARLAAELSGWRGLEGAWLFGSTARGDGGRDSDVDLLLVAASVDAAGWMDTAGSLRDRVRAWTGNEAQLLEHTRESFARLVRGGNPLVKEIRSDGIPLVPGSRALLRTAA